ncbi:uncharacterized protein LOC131167588 [Malania oleifera]|uniref:uncharacterized protein LOC131167588 n=1 Tax=Malania oleifera TaxID=397392 RepID=UPI0025AE0689|nr:uncharacterized protein LOC131167588 [Malania oleifera]
MMCNGEFLHKDPDEAIEYLNDIAKKAHTWTGPSATESTNRSQLVGNPNGGGIYHLKEEDNLKAKVEMLTRELEGKTNQKFESLITQVVEEKKEIKSQVSKLISSLSVNERGKFPSQAQSEPHGQHTAQENLKDVNVIVTRSSKSLHIPTTNKSEDVEKNQDSSDAELTKEPEVTKSLVKVPFPQALKSSKRTLDPNNEILENLRQVKINLPLLHVIKQVPTYAKVFKDLFTVKRKHHVKKTTFLTEQLSALIEQRIPPKYKDLGCLTIAYSIGNHEFGQALLDLEASVNLMPYSIYLQSGLGEIKPTTVVLQLADRLVNIPWGVVEDVLIQIDKFYYPVDFLILDTSSAVDTTSKIPLILGRHFLATANALINFRNGLMKLSFGNMTLEVNIFHIEKQLEDDDEGHQTYMIDSLMNRGVSTSHDFDPLEYFLVNYEFDSINNPSDVVDICAIFDRTHDYGTRAWQPKFEELPEKGEKQIPSNVEAPKVELKPLPKGLKHAFLGLGDTFPIIISSKIV